MSSPPYRALRIVLGVLSLIAAVVGLFAVFSSKALLLRLPFAPPDTEVTTLLLATAKEMGGFMLMLSLLLFWASRDPARNLAIVNALTVGLFILAVTPVLSLYTTDIGRLYPAYLIWVRSLVRLALAGLIFYLRPRPAAEVNSRL